MTHLVVQSGVVHPDEDPVHAQVETQQDEETGRHHPLQQGRYKCRGRASMLRDCGGMEKVDGKNNRDNSVAALLVESNTA